MSTNTYIALDKITVTGSAVSSVTFNGISQSYTDLVLVMNGKVTSAANNLRIQVGSGSVDSGNNYSMIYLAGEGSTILSGNSGSTSSTLSGRLGTVSSTNIINFMNYSNTTTHKTIISRGGDTSTGGQIDAYVNTWRSTSAINTIKVLEQTGDPYAVGTTFSLYGIKAEGVSPTVKATGGTVYSDSTYYYHVFGASGTFTPTQSITADCLVVAGGAGGGRSGGGGGAGGLLAFTSQSLTATGYTVTVGSGGAGNNTDGQTGTIGGDSQFGALTLVKGGGGGGSYGANGATGGSGGGGGGYEGTARTGGSATGGQGNSGGNGFAGSLSTNRAGGGGGGAGASGAAATSGVGGNGGVGLSSYSSWGVATGVGQNVLGTYYLAGGGGAYGNYLGGTGGYGGGGNKGVNAVANTGGGGGGSASDGTTGFNGGSGVVIVRYAK
jgi:hypothetical protein